MMHKSQVIQIALWARKNHSVHRLAGFGASHGLSFEEEALIGAAINAVWIGLAFMDDYYGAQNNLPIAAADCLSHLSCAGYTNRDGVRIIIIYRQTKLDARPACTLHLLPSGWGLAFMQRGLGLSVLSINFAPYPQRLVMRSERTLQPKGPSNMVYRAGGLPDINEPASSTDEEHEEPPAIRQLIAGAKLEHQNTTRAARRALQVKKKPCRAAIMCTGWFLPGLLCSLATLALCCQAAQPNGLNSDHACTPGRWQKRRRRWRGVRCWKCTDRGR
jgi:hypothetical protein